MKIEAYNAYARLAVFGGGLFLSLDDDRTRAEIVTRRLEK